MTTRISIIEDFHPFPAGRYLADGAGNGTAFRDKFLVPILEAGEAIEIDLDGAPGYPSSFLEEAFGGLVRKNVAPDLIRKNVSFHATKRYERYIQKIWDYVEAAERAQRAKNSA